MDAVQQLILFLQKQNPQLFKSLDEELSEVAGRLVHVIVQDEVTMGGWHEREKDGSVTVYLDRKYPEDIRLQVAYHEVIEDHEMVDRGLGYDEAHEVASKKEKEKFGKEAYERGLRLTNDVLRANARVVQKDVAVSTNPEVFTPTAGGGREKSLKENERWLGKEAESKQYICRGIEQRLLKTLNDSVEQLFESLEPSLSRPLLLLKMRDTLSHWSQDNILAAENSLQLVGRPLGGIQELADETFKGIIPIISAAYSAEGKLDIAFLKEATKGKVQAMRTQWERT